jgi:non-specific serine/threonine protein kinase
MGNHELARALLEESLPILATTGRPRGSAIAHQSLAIVAFDQGDYERARVETQQGLEFHQKAGDHRAAAIALSNLASVAVAQRDFLTAAQSLRESLGILRDIADSVATAGVLEHFAVLLAAIGRPEPAQRLAGAAEKLRGENGVPLPPAARSKLDGQIGSNTGHLTAAALLSAREAGRMLSSTEAVAEALSAVDTAFLSGAEPEDRRVSETIASLPGYVLDPKLTAPREFEGQGSAQLTRREREIAALIARGATNRQIADALVITEGTAANHVLHILSKLGLASRTQIAVWALQQGLIATASNVRPIPLV